MYFRNRLSPMKLLGIVFLFLSTLCFSQSLPIHSKLKAAYEPAYLDRIQKTNPMLFKRWSYYADHAYYIAEDTPDKLLTGIESLKANPTDINIFLLEKQFTFLKRNWDKPMAYKIKNTDKLLVYYSGKQFNAAFQKWLSNE